MTTWPAEFQLETDAGPHALWSIWTDFIGWPDWDPHCELARLDGPLQVGTTGYYKPKGSPGSKLRVAEVEPGRRFLNDVKLPLATMHADHEVRLQDGGGAIVTNRVDISGPLAFLWKRIIGRKLEAEHRGMLEGLVTKAGGLVVSG